MESSKAKIRETLLSAAKKASRSRNDRPSSITTEELATMDQLEERKSIINTHALSLTIGLSKYDEE